MFGFDRSSAKPFEHDCDTSDNFKHSQVRKQENVQSTETLKQAKVTPSDGGFQRRLSTTANPIDTDNEFCNMGITDSDYIENIFRFLQKKCGVQEGHESFSVRASKTNILMWGLFMSSSMRAAIHLEQNYKKNLETYKFTNFEHIESLFSVAQNLVVDNPSEILDSRSLCWTRSTLAHVQVKSWSKAKVRVYSHSVLCLVENVFGRRSEDTSSEGVPGVLFSGRISGY